MSAFKATHRYPTKSNRDLAEFLNSDTDESSSSSDYSTDLEIQTKAMQTPPKSKIQMPKFDIPVVQTMPPIALPTSVQSEYDSDYPLPPIIPPTNVSSIAPTNNPSVAPTNHPSAAPITDFRFTPINDAAVHSLMYPSFAPVYDEEKEIILPQPPTKKHKGSKQAKKPKKPKKSKKKKSAINQQIDQICANDNDLAMRCMSIYLYVFLITLKLRFYAVRMDQFRHKLGGRGQLKTEARKILDVKERVIKYYREVKYCLILTDFIQKHGKVQGHIYKSDLNIVGSFSTRWKAEESQVLYAALKTNNNFPALTGYDKNRPPNYASNLRCIRRAYMGIVKYEKLDSLLDESFSARDENAFRRRLDVLARDSSNVPLINHTKQLLIKMGIKKEPKAPSNDTEIMKNCKAAQQERQNQLLYKKLKSNKANKFDRVIDLLEGLVETNKKEKNEIELILKECESKSVVVDAGLKLKYINNYIDALQRDQVMPSHLSKRIIESLYGDKGEEMQSLIVSLSQTGKGPNDITRRLMYKLQE